MADLELTKTMTVEKLITSIQDRGLTAGDSALLLAEWIKHYWGRSPRSFDYKTSFPAVETKCTPTFNRTLHHADWVDGESVVQAGATPNELGFNARFHQIEHDLDALAADNGKLFACVAELRSQLRSLLDEVRAELNRLNDNVYSCCNRDPRLAYPLPDKLDPGFFWVKPLTLDPLNTIRITRAAAFHRFVADNRAFNEFVRANPRTSVAALIERFGRNEMSPDLDVEDALAILPPDATFDSGEAIANAIDERESAAIRTSDDGRAIADVLGLGAGERGANASVVRVSSISPEGRTALARNGIATIGELAAAKPAELVRRGITNNLGEAAAWIGTARAISGVTRRTR